MNKHYEHLFQKNLEIRMLQSISMLLEWDQQTYMPKGAFPIRSTQQSLMQKLIHEKLTSSEYGALLEQLIDLESGTIHLKEANAIQRTSLIDWRKEYLKNTKLPSAFVEKFAQETALAFEKWEQAKSKKQFDLFQPHLETIVSLCQKKADYLGYDKHPYDALLDLYEPEMTCETLSSIFEEVKSFLIPLLKKIQKHQKDQVLGLYGNFEKQKLEQFHALIMENMGIEQQHARLDYSSHPFCLGLHPHDVRLTTFVDTSNPIQSISAVLHESGHALYELGLPKEYYGTPAGEHCSIGFHESQSRFYETIIGQSKPFWTYFYPKLQTLFPKPLGKVSLEDFYQNINFVQPSLIRVYADEVTYILHIIIRFEIEKALLEGTLSVQELPNIWNQKIYDYLHITPKTHTEGCLQDVHWSCGLIGYFPTYALGSLYAAQLYETFQQEIPDYEERLMQGDLIFIKKWLGMHVHQYGKQYPPKELIQKATGKPLSAVSFKKYLEKKYTY